LISQAQGTDFDPVMAQVLHSLLKTKYMKKIPVLFLSLFLIAGIASAQLRKVPSEVTNAFTAAYPLATNVTWKDNLSNFQAQFDQSGDACVAKFNSNGEWLETTRNVKPEHMNASVKDGFNKSKYKDWQRREIKELKAKDKETLYRIYVYKSDLNKRYLFFNEKGQLIRDALTL
jgi:hypothetical protein